MRYSYPALVGRDVKRGLPRPTIRPLRANETERDTPLTVVVWIATMTLLAWTLAEAILG